MSRVSSSEMISFQKLNIIFKRWPFLHWAAWGWDLSSFPSFQRLSWLEVCWTLEYLVNSSYLCILPDCPDWSSVCIHWKGGGCFDWQSWQKYLIKIYIDFLWHDFQRFFQQTLLLWTKAEKLFLLPVWKGSFWKIMERVYLSICAAAFVLGKTRSTSTPVFPALKLRCF